MAPHVINIKLGEFGGPELNGVLLNQSGGVGWMVHDYPMRSNGAETVTETLSLTVIGSSISDMQSRKATLERLLDIANRRNDIRSPQYKTGDKTFLRITPDGDSTTWRAEILEARLEADASALIVWGNKKEGFRLTLTRTVWEDDTERAITIVNNNGTNSTGLTVYNHEDGGAGHDNFVQIAAAQITGSLPAPAIIKWKNSFGSGLYLSKYYFWNNAYATPNTLWYVLEGENALAGYGGASAADATMSNGNKWSISFTDTAEIRFGSMPYYAAGRPVHLLAHIPFFSSGVYVKPELWDQAGVRSLTPNSSERLLTTDSHLHDLGTLWSGLRTSINVSNQLVLKLRGIGSKSVDLDFIHLAGPDSFRQLETPGAFYLVANLDTVIDDGVNDEHYVLTNAGSRYDTVITHGEPLMLFPNVDQRIGCLWTGVTMLPNWTATLQLSYRPRKANL